MSTKVIQAPSSERVWTLSAIIAPGKLLVGLGLCLLVLLYVFPLAAVSYVTGPRTLPPVFAPDLYFYLKMGDIQTVGTGMVLNPWYGVTAHISDVIYYRFGLLFRLLVGLQHLVGANFAETMLVWSIVINFGIALACFKLFQKIFPTARTLAVFTATALVMLVSVTDLHALNLKLLASGVLPTIPFPYIRTFFPQVPALLLFIYLLFQINALQSQRIRFWLTMALVQLLGLMVFPYVVVVMAFGTVITDLIYFLQMRGRGDVIRSGLKYFLLFAAASVVLDVGFIAWAGFPTAGLTANGVTFWHPDLAHLGFYVGLAILLLASITIVEFLIGLRTRSLGVLSLACTGLGVCLLHFSNVLVDPAFPIALHFDYLLTTMLTLLLGCLLIQIFLWLEPRTFAAKWLAAAVCAVILIYGGLVSLAIFQNGLSANAWQASVERALQRINLQPTDLVVAPAETVDGPADWVPLIANTQVLFTLNAESVLDGATRNQLQRDRLALYLYLAGKDARWVESVIAPGNPDARDLNIMVNISQRGPLGSPNPKPVFDEIRAELEPRLAALAANPQLVSDFVKGYRRVIFIDDPAHPTFSAAIIGKHLDIVDTNSANDVKITTTIPKNN